MLTEPDTKAIILAVVKGTPGIDDARLEKFVSWCDHAMIDGGIVGLIIGGEIHNVEYHEDGNHRFNVKTKREK